MYATRRSAGRRGVARRIRNTGLGEPLSPELADYLGVSLDDSLIVPSEKAMLEDLIVAALHDARAKADVAANSEMQRMSSGLPLPPGFKLPF